MTTTILWRPEPNHLTTPDTYCPRHMPRGSVGYDELAAGIAERNPIYNEGLGKGFMLEMREEIKQQMLKGNQVSLKGLFTCHISLSGRLDSPDDPLPSLEESLRVKLYASRSLTADVRKDAHMEREAPEKKLPLLSTAQDTVLELRDVLNPDGALQLTGDDIYFDRKQPGAGECVIEGTESGRTVQSRYIKVEDSEIIFMPEVPAQSNPWNNEYTVSVSTHYTEHGTLRTGTYGRMLRTPLTVPVMGLIPPPGTGILTGSAATPYVSITGGMVSADTRLRIQVIQDLTDNRLMFSLLDMEEDGTVGDEVAVTVNGAITLPGFAGSPVSDLALTVNDYAALWEMIRNDYGGRLVDVLDVRM